MTEVELRQKIRQNDIDYNAALEKYEYKQAISILRKKQANYEQLKRLLISYDEDFYNQLIGNVHSNIVLLEKHVNPNYSENNKTHKRKHRSGKHHKRGGKSSKNHKK